MTLLGLGVLVLKLTLIKYNQNLFQINFIEFIIVKARFCLRVALPRYALFRRLSTKSYSNVTIYIVSMTECTNHRPWDTETPSHKISHDEYYEKRGTTDKTKHKPSMSQPRIRHTRITTTSKLLL